MNSPDLRALAAAIRDGGPSERGAVLAVSGTVIRISLPEARVGARLSIGAAGSIGWGPGVLAEVVGFDGVEAIALPLASSTAGIRCGAPARLLEGTPALAGAGPGLLGRVLDALGEPIDGGAPLDRAAPAWPLRRRAPDPLRRRPVEKALPLGVRALDALCTIGAGQRVGLHSGPGAGKTTLLGQIAARSSADVVVVALLGERGREIGDFLRLLGGGGLPPEHACVIVARADDPPLAWLRGAELATAVAEYFREQGRDVLLLMDSLTRVARAIRTVGIAAGEPASRRGFPPSLATTLPALVERAANDEAGTLTAVYTVLVEGEASEDPVAEEARALLDGHIVLDPALAGAGRFPALAVGRSVSRCMDAVIDPTHRAAASTRRRWLAALERHQDLLAVGAYKAGGDADLDRALARRDELEAFLRQRPDEVAAFDDTLSRLVRLVRP